MPMCKMFIIVDKKFRYHTPPKIGWTQLSVFRSAIFPRYFSALHNTDPGNRRTKFEPLFEGIIICYYVLKFSR